MGVSFDVVQSIAVRFDELTEQYRSLIQDQTRISFDQSCQREKQLAIVGGEAVRDAWSNGLLMEIKVRYNELETTLLDDLEFNEYGDSFIPTFSMVFYRVVGYCSPFFHFGKWDNDDNYCDPYLELDVGCLIDWRTFALGQPICSYDCQNESRPRDSILNVIYPSEESPEDRFIRKAQGEVLRRYVLCCRLLADLTRNNSLVNHSEAHKLVLSVDSGHQKHDGRPAHQ